MADRGGLSRARPGTYVSKLAAGLHGCRQEAKRYAACVSSDVESLKFHQCSSEFAALQSCMLNHIRSSKIA
eukprot:ANDGO_00295.mRNA.1 hypothetical protein